MADNYYQDPLGAPDYSAQGMPSLLSLSNLESLGRGSVAGLFDLPYFFEGMLMGDEDPRMPQRKRVVPSSEQVLATTPRMTQPTPQAGLLETAGAFMSPAPVAAVKPVAKAVGKAVKATEGLPVGMSIKPINLSKGIYKPELTMEEMLKVKDIPTVERVRKSIDLVGEKEFEKMVNAQYKKYKPVDQDQEAMLVESVTLDILGRAQRSPYPQQAALDLAQQRAALPVSEGGLGLPANNTPMDRAKAMAGLTKENAMSQAHNIGELEFLAIPNQQFKGKLLYQSPSYSGKKGSVYKLGTINDEPAYLRQSDHFGGFATNLIEGSPEFKAIEEIQKLETGDIFGRVGKTTNQWNLKGGKAELKSQEIENALQEYRNSKTDSNPLGSDKLLDKYLKFKKTGKETGAIPLSELIGRLPEKKYSVVSETGERFEVPMIRMPDGSFRSRFAAFDPFRKDVATATAMGVALPDLLAAEPTPQPQSSGLLYPFP